MKSRLYWCEVVLTGCRFGGVVLALLLSARGARAVSLAEQNNFYSYKNIVDGPIFYQASGTTYPSYDKMEAKLLTLTARHPQTARLIRYGKSVEGRNLNLVRIAEISHIAVEKIFPAVEMSGVIHGNEYLGIEDKLVEYFLEHRNKMPGLNKYLAGGGVIYAIPVINPDGFVAGSRGNHNSINLNRDFDVLPINEMHFSQPETFALAEYLDHDLTYSHLQLKVSVDYHCCIPALIIPWSYIDALPGAADQLAFDLVSAFQAKYLGYKIGNALHTAGYTATGTSIDYFYAKYAALGLTIEGNYGGEENVFLQHVRFWDAIFQAVADGQLQLHTVKR